MEKFFEALERQFVYGGQKYAQTSEKEATDVLFDDFGKNWLLGTIAKYCKRYSNLARERDLLKIATYMYILWLKRGYHLDTRGSANIINTTVTVKSAYFPIFQKLLLKYKEESTLPVEVDVINQIYRILLGCANKPFQDITEKELYNILILSYYIWDKDITDKGTDEDVFNEQKGKK